jgi:hypothetical protein
VWTWDGRRPTAPLENCVGAVMAVAQNPSLVVTTTGSIVRCEYRWYPRMIGIPETGFVVPFRLPR